MQNSFTSSSLFEKFKTLSSTRKTTIYYHFTTILSRIWGSYEALFTISLPLNYHFEGETTTAWKFAHAKVPAKRRFAHSYKAALPIGAAFFVGMIFLMVGQLSFAASRFAIASGNWSSTSTWSATSGGASGASVPGASDDVTIEGGFTVTVDAAQNAKSLAINSGTLNVNNNLTISSDGGPFAVNSGGTIVFNSTGIANGGGNGAHGVTVTIASGANLTTANANGISGALSSGSIQIDNGNHSVTFSTGANYTYNGSAAQITGTALTGANNLTINNSSGVTLTSSTSVSGSITIQSGTFDIGTNTLTISGSATGTVQNGGILKSAGTVTTTGALTFQSGGKYQHNFTTTAGTIPTATWNSGSTCEIIGYTTNTSAPSGLSQSFSNFTWNCTNQGSANVQLAGNLTTVNGAFNLSSTGSTGALNLSAGTNYTLTIGGNMTVSGGTLQLTTTSATAVVNLSGDFSQTSGIVNLASGSSQNPTVTFNVSGNFSNTAGNNSFRKSDGTGTGKLVFKKSSGTQTFSSNNISTSSSALNVEIGTGSTTNVVSLSSSIAINSGATLTVFDGSTLSMGTNVISGGTFTGNSGSTLEIGSTDGITAAACGTGASCGNIRTTNRTFNTDANYTFNGTSQQFTGSGLTGARNLTFSNTSGTAPQVKFNSGSISVSGDITVSSGCDVRNLTGTGATLTMSGSAPTLSVAGSVTGTNVGSGNDLNLTYSGTGTLTVSGSGSLCRFLNATMSNTSSTLVLSRSFEVMFGTFTVNGTLQLNSGGSVSSVTNAVGPTYGSSSLLKYNSGTTYGRSIEWSATSGAGYPNNVQVSNSTTLDIGANSGTGTARQMAGSLTIDAGSTFQLAGSNPMTQPVTVLGSVTNNGTLNLSTSGGGDIKVGGNWTKGSSATFTPSGRSVTFNGTGSTQTIQVTGGGTETFSYLINNPSSATSLVLAGSPNATSVLVNGSGGGNSLQLQNGTLDLNQQTLTFTTLFNSSQHGIGIDGSSGNFTRTVTSTGGSGTFAVTHADASTRIASISRLSGNASLLSFSSNVTVTISGTAAGASGIDFGTGLSTLNGKLQINNKGFVNTNPPTYASGSTLLYNTGNAFTASSEWTTGITSGAGVPSNVQIGNGAASSSLSFGSSSAFRQLTGDLTITNNSGATLTLSSAAGGDLQIAGNWINNGTTANFTSNGRIVTFNGSAAQSIGGSNTNAGGYAFGSLTINNSSGTGSGNGVTLNKAATVANTLTMTKGVLWTTASLTINNTANSGTSGGVQGATPSYVDGQLNWVFPSGAPGTNYNFPVGNGGNYLPFTLNSPTGLSGPTVTVQAFNADVSASPTLDGTLSSISHTEYWQATSTSTFSSNIAITRQTALSSLNKIAKSTAQGGTYSSITGSTSGTTITTTTPATIGSFFVMAVAQPDPTISSVVPQGGFGNANNTGYNGQTIQINGSNFVSGAMSVTFNGTAATSVSFVSSSQITAVVANSGANSSGNVVVTNTNTSGNTSASFDFIGYITNANTDWNTTSTWLGNVLPAASATTVVNNTITINSAVSNAISSGTINSSKSITFSSSGTITTSTLNNNGSVVMTSGGTLTIAASGTFTNNSTFTGGSGTVSFSGAGTINGSSATTFNNLTINTGAVTISTVPTIGGTLQINGGNLTAAPKYGASSTLLYNVSYGRFVEWNAIGVGTIGTTAGYPNNVTINTGTFDVYNSASGEARALAGTLTVNTGATMNFNGMNATFTVGSNMAVNGTGIVNMNTMSGQVTVTGDLTVGGTLNMNTMSAAITVNGNVSNSGTLSLSTSGGGDMNTGGNWSNSGTFNANSRAVTFTSTASGKTISGSLTGSNKFAYITFNGVGGAWSFSASAEVGNNFTITNGSVTAPSGTLTVSGNFSNSGTFTHNNGTVAFTGGNTVSGTIGFYDVTIGGGSISLGSTSTINNSFTINASGSVSSGQAPTYATGSTLIYNCGCNYGAGEEWYQNTFGSNPGVPYNVTLNAGTSLNFGSTTFAREVRGDFSISGTSTFALSTANGGDVKIDGNWIRNSGGTFTPNGRAVFFIGGNSQTLTGTTTFDYVIINKSSNDLSLASSSNMIVNQTLTLTQGLIVTGSNNVTINSSGSTASASSSSYVKGNLVRAYSGSGSKDFPIGNAGYEPITLNYSALTGTSTVTAFQTDATIPGSIPSNATVQSGRYWTVSQTGGSAFSYFITLDGTGFSLGSYAAAIIKGDGSTNSAFAASVSVNNYTNSSAFSSFSNFAVGGQCATTVSAGSDFTKTCVTNPSGAAIGESNDASATYSWSPATGLSSATVSNPTANPTATTTYTVTKTTTANGCTATATVTATVNITAPTVSAGSDFTKTCVTNPSGAAIGETNDPSATYSWSPSTGLSSATVSNPTANPTTTTTYTVTKTTTANGCTATATVTATVNITAPTVSAGSDFTKTCVTNPSGAAIGESNDPSATYSWSPSTGLSSATVSNPTANPTTTTTYTVTKTTTANGCTATATVTATVNITAPTVSAGSDFTKTCVDNASGAAIGESNDPSATYLWSPATGLSSATVSNPTANPTVTTTYTVTKTTTANGCTATATVTATVNITAPSVSAGSDFTKTCVTNPSGAAIGESNDPSATYSWSPSTGLSSATVSNPTANPTVTTTYTVTKTTTANGCTATATVTATVNITAPTVSAGSDFTKTCVTNPSGAAIGESNDPSATYSWSPATGLSSATVSNPTANPTTTTTYTVTKTTAANGCTATSTVTATVNITAPSVSAGSDFTKTCVTNPSGAAIGETNDASATYSWSPATGLSSATVSNPTANPTTTTTYTVTKTTTANGCTATATVTATVNITAPTVSAGSDFTKTCVDNASGAAIGEANDPSATYSWSPATGLSSATVSNPTANPTTTTTYTVTKTTTSNGCTATATVTATVNITAPTVSAGSDFNKTCVTNPSGAAIGESNDPSATYSWSPSTGLSSATVSNPTANPTTTTTYTVTKTTTLNGCTATATVTATVNITAPTVSAGSDFDKTCVTNPSGAAIGESNDPSATYSWSPATGLSSATVSSPTANPTTTTTYTVTKTTNANGCTATAIVTATVNITAPSVSAGSDFTKTCVDNESGAAIGESNDASATYSWSPSTGLSSATVSNPTANPTTTTTYTVTKTTTANGCTATATVTATVNITAPTVSAGSDFTKTCVDNVSGAPIGESNDPSATYSWSPSTGLSSATVSNPTANPTTTTTYTVTKTTTANGCTATATVTATVNITAPSVSAGSDFTKTCVTNPTGASIGESNDASATYSWSPATGLSSATVSNPTANPTTTTTYTVTKTTTANGCTATATVTATVNIIAPSVSAGSDFTKTCTSNPSGAAIGETNDPSATYSWSPATGLSSATVSNPTANPAVTTTYTVTKTTTANGCTATATVTATVNTTTVDITPGSNPSVCYGATSANLSYSGEIGNPDQYSVDYNAAAEAQGFTDVTNASLPSSPIVLTISGAVAGTYNAILTVRNSSTGCVSGNYNISVTVIASGTWLGTTSVDWNTASNWCGGTPTSTTDVVIPSGTPFQPDVTSGNNYARNLSVAFGVTLDIIGGTFHVSGNTTNNGTINQTGGTVSFDGATSQTIPALTLGNVTINNAAGVTITGDLTVNGTLTFTSGTITTGSNTVIITSTGSVAHTDGWVNGNLRRYVSSGSGVVESFDIGDDTHYLPVTITFSSVSVAGNLTGRTNTGDHPEIASSHLNAGKSVKSYWTFGKDGALAFTTYDATFNWPAGYIDPSADAAHFVIGKFDQ